MHKTVRIHTDDPDRPRLTVAIKGTVESVVKISTQRVVLRGPSSEKMVGRVRITPSARYPFMVRKISAKDGRFIQYTLTPAAGSKADHYELTVTNTRKQTGRYTDIITIETNSGLRPRIPVYVIGDIRAAAGS